MSILEADFNYENLNFKRLFSPSECVDKYKSWNNEFSWHQTGGEFLSLATLRFCSQQENIEIENWHKIEIVYLVKF